MLSATMPIKTGMKAPPAIADTINPDNSFVCSGIVSIAIENINGKMFANPRPARNIPINVRTNDPLNMRRMPESATNTVISNNFLGFILVRIIDPKNRPDNIGRYKSDQLISIPSRSTEIENFSFNRIGIWELMDISRPQ